MSTGKTMKVYFEATVYEDGPVTLKRPNGMIIENVAAVAKGQLWKSKTNPKATWTVFLPCFLEDGTPVGQLSAKSSEIRPSKFSNKATEVVEAEA
jgi:hypothetical protein